MSSTPTTPKPTSLSSEISAVETKIGLWLDPAHIVLVIALGLSLLGGVFLYESKAADAWKAKAEAAAAIADAAKKAGADSAIQNAATQAQDKALEAQMAAVNAQLQTANAQLLKANAQLTTALAKQKAADVQLPPDAQAQRIMQLEPKAKVVAVVGGFSVDASGGLAILQDLEEIPVDRQKIINDDQQLMNDVKTIANDGTALAAEHAAHLSDVTNDGKQLDSCQADLKKTNDQFTAYKHNTRKNYIKVFFAGVVVGLFGGHAAGF